MESLDVRLQKRMHASLYALLVLTVLLGISVLLEGCTDKCETRTKFTYFEPVYKTTQELRAEIGIVAPQPLTRVGKIYRFNSLLFVNQPAKGVHIIDNSNPANPIVKSFLKIPGNMEMAVSGNHLYADNYTDLVVFDLSNPEDIKEVGRVESVFNNPWNVEGFVGEASNGGIITDWVARETMEFTSSDCNTDVGGIICSYEGVAVADAAAFYSNFSKSSASTPGNGSGPGVGGSMARFTINGNHLYALSHGYLLPFDLANPSAPSQGNESVVAFDVETIFPYGNYLFLGAQSGMHIYDVSTPQSPAKVSDYTHVRSCDPVVVEGNYAYVTLRTGTTCFGTANQLEVIDISNIHSPQLVAAHPMVNPHGLGIDNGTLFICDGSAGLKVFDASDVLKISENSLAHYSDVHAYDVIPWNDVLVMIGENGLFQYDYSNPADIKLLSHIPVSHD